jgi:hypothetical protein
MRIWRNTPLHKEANHASHFFMVVSIAVTSFQGSSSTSEANHFAIKNKLWVVSRGWSRSEKGLKSRRVESQLAPADERVSEDDAMERDSRNRMIYADSRAAVEQAWVGFVRKWKLRCKAGTPRFEEAGEDLFTFAAFPSSQW